MTNLEVSPIEEVCPPGLPGGSAGNGPCLQLWPAREVPLGGVRAMNVFRTLPQRGLPTVGAWCFLDSFGPDRVAMSVLPHPHTGLQTVTWPLAGNIRHRDSVGSDVIVRPGELNIMTAGRGVSHSEFAVLPHRPSPGETMGAGPSGAGTVAAGDSGAGAELPLQRGLQLWVALPDGERHRDPAFEQHRDLPEVTGDGFTATVMVGNFAGESSPATMYSPIVGVDVSCSGPVALPLDPEFEHAVLVLDGRLTLDGQDVPPGPLGYLGIGRRLLEVEALPDTRFILLGGEPLQEELLMWWNFVGRTHDEVAQARQDWENQADLPDALAEGSRFGLVRGHGPDAGVEAGRIPAPPLPGVRLRPRTRS
ncbi:redox-sensitive bicupin YhaK (pirin superfamily) [Arthrobacter sp. PvP102]|uniref:pirin family protein n=1 Tax=unclassified Arthrobacter TaxID=235627 RepID=UPI0000527238|nr:MULTISPECIES: pirin family protein [unclassified Arthrobacter]ABK04223.1 Pirin domain protein [Arthrobacter sp. FB24]MBP1232153.1 redox-sensitive bicupin YhaK (pirin superfamily) [Arthrobacter sp. PvP103]MBP1237288.1 redox-sensitive bicupin YhaK (pirin superfamily) [Arthrobacter sp. PvP102]